jgi:hypothetical protein
LNHRGDAAGAACDRVNDLAIETNVQQLTIPFIAADLRKYDD